MYIYTYVCTHVYIADICSTMFTMFLYFILYNEKGESAPTQVHAHTYTGAYHNKLSEVKPTHKCSCVIQLHKSQKQTRLGYDCKIQDSEKLGMYQKTVVFFQLSIAT